MNGYMGWPAIVREGADGTAALDYSGADNGPYRPYDPADTDSVPLDAFAWPGGYSVVYWTADETNGDVGTALCPAHAWVEIVQRDTPLVRETYDEGPPLLCEGDTSRPHYVIASYGDPDADGFGTADLDTERFPEWYAASRDLRPTADDGTVTAASTADDAASGDDGTVRA